MKRLRVLLLALAALALLAGLASEVLQTYGPVVVGHCPPASNLVVAWWKWRAASLPPDPFAGTAHAPFLNQPVPFDSKNVVKYNSLEERIEMLKKIVPKPIHFPDGFADYVAAKDRESDWDKGHVLFLSERSGLPPGKNLGDFMTATFFQLDLKWRYDTAQDCIDTAFLWQRLDNRTAPELASTIIHTSAAPKSPFFDALATASAFGVEDPWRSTFDALISDPGNFSRAWPIRFLDDACHDGFFMFDSTHQKPPVRLAAVDNVFAGKLKDTSGHEHIVVLNQQPPMINLGRWTLTYYVFDLSGTFEQGGMFEGCHRGEDTSAWTNWRGTELTLRSHFNRGNAIDQHLVLTNAGLALKNVTSEFYGGTMPPSAYAGYRIGFPIMHIPN